MNFDPLLSFGLHKNDITIYKALIKIGRSKTGAIIVESEIGSSRVYESLRILVRKGLVSYEVKNNVKYYNAELPEQLIEETIQSAETLRELSKQITKIPIAHKERNETNTYEGIYGFKSAFLKHMAQIEKNEEVGVIAFNSHTINKTKFGQLNKLFAEVDKTLFSKTKNVKMLLDKQLYPLLKQHRTHFKMYILRFLPQGYFSPMAVNISKNEVMLSVWGPKPVVFTARNPIIVESFRNNFNFLWNIAKK